MLPDLDSLRCFEAAAVHGSFRAAASAVALSPPAFSERMRRLEDDLGTRLFDRTGRGVELTAAGERLLPHVRELLQRARRCTAIAKDRSTTPFSLTIGTRFELGLSWLEPALDGLAEAVPARTLHLYFGGTEDLLIALDQGRVDAVVGSMRTNRADLAQAGLHEEEYSFVASPQLLAKHPLTGPADAPQHRLVDATPNLPLFRYWRDAQPTDQSWQFGDLRFMGTIAAIRARVLAGIGVAVLPSYFIRPDLTEERLVELDIGQPARPDRFRLLWRAGHPRSRDLGALAAELRELPLK